MERKEPMKTKKQIQATWTKEAIEEAKAIVQALRESAKGAK